MRNECPLKSDFQLAQLTILSQYNCSLFTEFKFKKLFPNFQLTFWLLNEETQTMSRSSRENIFWVTEENIWSICHFGRCHGGRGGRSVRLSVVTRTGTYFSETCHPWKLLWLWLPVINKYMAQYEHVESVMAVPRWRWQSCCSTMGSDSDGSTMPAQTIVPNKNSSQLSRLVKISMCVSLPPPATTSHMLQLLHTMLLLPLWIGMWTTIFISIYLNWICSASRKNSSHEKKKLHFLRDTTRGEVTGREEVRRNIRKYQLSAARLEAINVCISS